MDFEDILLDVGDYGKYQQNLIRYFLIPAASLLPWFTMNIFFMVSVPDHWCNVPEVSQSGLNLTIKEQRYLIGPPDEKCYMYNINYTDFLSNGSFIIPENTTTRPCNQGWQYDKTYYDSTAATVWNMVCEDHHYTSFVLTLNNVGSILGTPIYGSLSDKIGRKITFFITIVVTAITAISSVLMTDFTAFIVLKTLNGSLMPSVFQLPYIIILEIVAPEMRTRMNGLVNCSWTVGLCILPLLAYLSRNWVTLGLITSFVTIIFFFYWTFLPESPRWLVSQERYEEAMKILSDIAIKNGKPCDKQVILQKLQKLGEKIKKEKTVDGVQNSSLDLLRYPQLRKKFIIITICWMADIMAYYGLQLNVSNLAGNEFVNFFLLSFVEIPGYLICWVVIEKFGRRWCTAAGFVLTGIICMFPAVDLPYMDVVCSMVGKFLAAGTFMATYQQSSELYPTVVRSLGMGMSSTIAMVATLIVPYLVYLGVYGKSIPFVIIGMSCIIAGLLATMLPETLNENLPQSIFEAEDFGKDQKFFSWNRRRRSVSKERAASFGLNIKGFDTICGDEKERNPKRSSKILQNIEMVPGIENTLMGADALKNMNGQIKRNSTDSGQGCNVISNTAISIPNEMGSHITSVPSSPDVIVCENNTMEAFAQLAVNDLPDTNGKLKASDKLPSNESGKFSYVNMVFDEVDKNVELSRQNPQGHTTTTDGESRTCDVSIVNDVNVTTHEKQS